MNTDTANAIRSAAEAIGNQHTRQSDQFIGQCVIGLATWAVLGAVSTYFMTLSVLTAMILSIVVSLIAALRGTDQAVGARTRGFFSGFVKSAK